MRKITEEAEKVVQASTSSDISKKRYFKRQINKYKLRNLYRFLRAKTRICGTLNVHGDIQYFPLMFMLEASVQK
ncbi:hypothetical protein BpHYR1_052946 [Brachionus plicatilis]|uniref:Uncharacterized protein n=1 Tax=Brachionus plicatilis TaxID=10195 RepID=A0A3M7RSQ3_BRAPC|nr:hypothetical protein BpHYR1_052946 [Brachionus plicatilis]